MINNFGKKVKIWRKIQNYKNAKNRKNSSKMGKTS